MNILDKLLMEVDKPIRYTGGELNQVVKDHSKCDISFAFCFPDVYEVGMSHLGMRILYHIINKRDDAVCERVFSPWIDYESKLRENNIELYSLETKRSLSKFDVVGFTLQYEMSFTNILNMLDLGNIPIRSLNRGENDPIICAGGPCAVNPEPLSEIIDFFMIGEGEEIINEVLDLIKDLKKKGKKRKEILIELATIEGIYVPSLYTVTYNEDGTIKKGVDCKIKKRIILDLDSVEYPDKYIVPYMNIVHDRVMIELFRGCIRGCRFCQAGYIYRPVREKKPETLINDAKKLLKNTGYEEISLASLSTSDYSCFSELTDELVEITTKDNVNISLPSLRIDSTSMDVLEKTSAVRKSGLTFAPEAGTQRMRDVINKNISEEDIKRSSKLAFEAGYSKLKLYFMLGLPTETQEDVKGIAEVAFDILKVYKEADIKNKRGVTLNVSTSFFVPKPFTPFQWEAQDTKEQMIEKSGYLNSVFKDCRKINYKWHETDVSFIEAVIARGDRRVGEVIIKAFEKGCKFDSWSKQFNYSKWIESFEECSVDPVFYANRKRSVDEILPWDHIDVGVTKKHLVLELEKAYECKVTPNCIEKCVNCGAAVYNGGVCVKSN